ncbi:histidine--tRNA ligase [Candidatus Bathyarchaeota archaeon]|nr:histidine--tRNA ligase [Candidatus Bathyarchaeota archaeon]
MVKFRPVRGMRDILPDEMIPRQRVLDTLREVFETFGFLPLETPALESWELLSAKGAGGPEVLEETYRFEDKAGRLIGLRYDLTVPLARVVASNPTLPLPFKRYQISRVWRYGDVAKGRLREFWQADVDVVGSASMLADAEVLACAITAFKRLGFKDFTVRLNHRKILSALIRYSGVEESKVIDAYRAIDKLDKIGLAGVERELLARGVSVGSAKRILDLIGLGGEADSVLAEAEDLLSGDAEGMDGIEDLRNLISYLKDLIAEPKLKVDLSLARGLDYYTGPIFEVSGAKKVGSLAGGGRYDKLIGLISGREVPATGISLGVERIIEVMKEKGMLTAEKSKVKVFVAKAGGEVVEAMLNLVAMLRERGIPTEFDLRGRSLKKQLEYADSRGINYVLIVGRKELEKRAVKLRDMRSRVEREVQINDLARTLENLF